MGPVGLLFRFAARPGADLDLARFLADDLGEALRDLPLTAWHGLRFAPAAFGLIAIFDDEEGQRAHIGDRIAEALRERGELLDGTPVVEGFDVVELRTPA